MPACGYGDDHCCWIDGKVCPHLIERADGGRRWVCTMFEKWGSWEAMTADPAWIKDVKSCYDRIGLVNCGGWPRPGETCLECGATGRG